MNFNEKFAMFILFYLAWTFVIHLLDENIMALIILLMVFLNIIAANCRKLVLMENNTNSDSSSDFAKKLVNDFIIYILHIVLASGFLIWYMIYSLDGVANTIKIWEKGFFGLNKTYGEFAY
tara:strand:- start:2208 stop:2570 length:363 start_codon:yes stop_codon:yes gene_type:complete